MLSTPVSLYSEPAKPAQIEQVNEEVKFVQSLDLNKLEQLILDMKYVPFRKYKYVKPAKIAVDTKHLEDLIKLIDLYNPDYVSEEIKDKEKFVKMINKTSKKLGYKNHEKWDIPGFIRWSTNLVRYWHSYNFSMMSGSEGIGCDLNKDGIGDRIDYQYFRELPRKIKKLAKSYPKKFVNSCNKEAERKDNTPLDKQLEESQGLEGKLKLVCRNLATLNQLVYETSKHLNPNSKNSYCFRVRNHNHMWNLFATVNEEGIFVTSVDPTLSDNGNKPFSKRAKLDYTRNGYYPYLWSKERIYLMAGSILRRNGKVLEALKLYSNYLLKTPRPNYFSIIHLAKADAWNSTGFDREAIKHYDLNKSWYSIYQQAYSLHKINEFQKSNQALKMFLNLYDKKMIPNIEIIIILTKLYH